MQFVWALLGVPSVFVVGPLLLLVRAVDSISANVKLNKMRNLCLHFHAHHF